MSEIFKTLQNGLLSHKTSDYVLNSLCSFKVKCLKDMKPLSIIFYFQLTWKADKSPGYVTAANSTFFYESTKLVLFIYIWMVYF